MELKKCQTCGTGTRHKGFRNCYPCIRAKQKSDREIKLAREAAKKAKQKEKKMMKPSKLKKTADTLYSLAIRGRDKVCQKCGATKDLQASHVKSRVNNLLRWDLQNGKALCYKCHIHWWHKEITNAKDWFVEKFGQERMDYLNKKQVESFKLTPDFVKERIDFLTNYLVQLTKL